ncbi:MAG: phage portal protein [Flavobacterium sp.]|nr:MAG: phage portal protein [Flavobacterium sp.]
MSLGGAFNLLFSDSVTSSGSGSGKSYLTDFFPYMSTGSGKPMHYKTSLKLSAVYNAVDQISNDIAKIPFRVYQELEGSRVRLKHHPADRIISLAPNLYMTSFVERKMMMVSFLLRGNALSIISTSSSGFPETTTYVPWDDVIDIRLVNGDLLYDIKGYDRPFLSSEVLHFKNFSLNGIVGVSVITYAAMQLDLAIEVQQFSATNFANKAVSKGVVEAEKQVGADAKKAIIAGVKTALADKSPDRVTVLDEGMKWKAITISPKDLEIIEQQRFGVEDIARWFNISLHKIKSLHQSTNNNIEQQSLDHVADTIQPHVTNWEQEYAKKLLTEKELLDSTYVRGNMNVLLRADIKSRGEYYSRAINFGWMNRNNVRELEDYDKGPAMLDEYLTPANTLTEEQIAKQLKE